MNYVIERELDYFDIVNREISRVLNWLSKRNKPCKGKKHMICSGHRNGQWEQILCHYKQKLGSEPPNYLNIHCLYKYTGNGWTFYIVWSSENDGRVRRDSVLITEDEVLAVEYKLSML